jgi:hypothetical protein
MNLTTHLCLVPRLRMHRKSGAVPLLSVYVFMAWTGAALPFLPLSYFLLAPSAQILIHIFFLKKIKHSEVTSVELYGVVT